MWNPLKTINEDELLGKRVNLWQKNRLWSIVNSAYLIDGTEWCYMTIPNQERPKYEIRFHCCVSSEPRAMEMYSNHLAGKINKRLSTNTFSLSTIQLTNQFDGGNIKIEGNFPSESSDKIHFDIAQERNFTLEFRLPANTRLANVSINGKKAESNKNEKGFIEINRKWEKSDIFAAELDYQLKAHFQDGEEYSRWVAFIYGTIALAQKITKIPDAEPFIKFNSTEPSELLKRFLNPPVLK